MSAEEEKGALERIEEMLVEMGFEPGEVTPEASLIVDLGLDSTERVELAVALQKEFSVKITRRELDDLGTVSAIAAHVEQCRKAGVA
ncbi:MAG: acyl carrier protein [Chloroflexi bacterium]|nr:acyl carrier protein [Chloroflexota bacterium]